MAKQCKSNQLSAMDKEPCQWGLGLPTLGWENPGDLVSKPGEGKVWGEAGLQ